MSCHSDLALRLAQEYFAEDHRSEALSILPPSWPWSDSGRSGCYDRQAQTLFRVSLALGEWRGVNVVAVIAAGGCALVFLAAALGKVDSWGPWSRLSEQIPGPPLLRRVVLFAVPGTETVIAVLNFVWPIAGLAAGTVALAVLAVAVALLARRLAGRECNCFGAIAPATIGPRLAMRNVALALLAGAGYYVVRQEKLQTLSLGAVIATVVVGATALMTLYFWRLHQAARLASLR